MAGDRAARGRFKWDRQGRRSNTRTFAKHGPELMCRFSWRQNAEQAHCLVSCTMSIWPTTSWLHFRAAVASKERPPPQKKRYWLLQLQVYLEKREELR